MNQTTTSKSVHPRYILFYDGICSLCDASVNFVIDHDRTGKIVFAPLQSDLAREMLPLHTVNMTEPETIFYLEEGILYERSTAALRVARHFGRPWNWIATILRVVPRPIRDAIYNWIARNRYAWFGRLDACRIPTPELKSRFLD